jgi:hypothetical protein
MHMKNTVGILFGLALIATVESGQGQGTAFSYQGRLADKARAANGTYDFMFTLFDALAGTNIIAGPATVPGATVSNGFFTAMLDFGAGAFNGSARWLEIKIRTNGDIAYVALTPRQPLTPTPYAILAADVSNTNVPRTFSGNTFTAPNTFLSPGNYFAGSFHGEGSGISNLDAGTLVSGTVSLARLPILDTTHVAAAVQTVGDSRWFSATNLINVKDFGAKGDGVADDTAAITAAWAFFTNHAGALFFPPGTYLDSATHAMTDWVTPGYISWWAGRSIVGMGSAVWYYTGTGQLLYGTRSFPDIQGIVFRGNPAATNCIYVSTVWNKLSIQNCHFEAWPNSLCGALTVDESDSVTIQNCSFASCSVGLGLGYRCQNLKADLVTRWCQTGVAVGVPTRNYPTQRESLGVTVNIMATYCGTDVAVDGGSYVNVHGFHWWPTNGAIWVGSIPGISTNYCCAPSLTLEDNYFTAGDPYGTPIHIFGAVYPSLDLVRCRFDLQTGTPVIKSHTANADSTRIEWHDSGAGLLFESSTGYRPAEASSDQSRFFNKALGIYNVRQETQENGTGYLLDVVDGFYPFGAGEPIARIGHSWGTGDLNDFWGGLTVQYDHATDAPTVAVTNADFYVTGNRPSGSPGGQVFAKGPINSTNGFQINTAQIVTGHGPPTIAAPPGSLYLNLDGGAGTTLYVKESGTNNSGWQAK